MKKEDFSVSGISRMESMDSDELNVDGIEADESYRMGSGMDVVEMRYYLEDVGTIS